MREDAKIKSIGDYSCSSSSLYIHAVVTVSLFYTN